MRPVYLFLDCAYMVTFDFGVFALCFRELVLHSWTAFGKGFGYPRDGETYRLWATCAFRRGIGASVHHDEAMYITNTIHQLHNADILHKRHERWVPVTSLFLYYSVQHGIVTWPR